MRRALCLIAAGSLVLCGVAIAAKKRSGPLPRDPRDVPMESRLVSTKTKADLDGDGVVEELHVVTVMTGRDDPAAATEVIYGVARTTPQGDRGPLAWVRHVAAETGKPAHHGEIMAVDLDGDGASELVLTWNRSLRATAVDKWTEIYAIDELSRPRRVWEGPWVRDTRRDAETPEGEREWFEREIDFGATRRQAGRALMLRTRYSMIGGKLVQPKKVVVERVDVRLRPLSSSR